jgi:hypothetical protein|tara:strand:- start:13892 stop:14491 length:600 start_codon:yes stop_codon:yes gene_type:complete
MRTATVFFVSIISTPIFAQEEGLTELLEEVSVNIPLEIQALSSISDTESPMSEDVAAYARFVWTVERVAGNCENLDIKPVVYAVDPLGDAWQFAASMDGHPDFQSFLDVIQPVDEFYEKTGAIDFCGTGYRLLGPDGDLMPLAMDLNALLAYPDEDEVTVAEGVLWSSREYCETEFHLQPPANEAMHELSCDLAASQGF